MPTNEQRYEANDRDPVTIVDPDTQESYVRMRSDLHERCCTLFTDEPFDVREAYPHMDAVATTEGWLDPEMDAYDRLDPRKPRPSFTAMSCWWISHLCRMGSHTI